MLAFCVSCVRLCPCVCVCCHVSVGVCGCLHVSAAACMCLPLISHCSMQDHVPPPQAPNPDGLNCTNPPFDFKRLGLRVPAVRMYLSLITKPTPWGFMWCIYLELSIAHVMCCLCARCCVAWYYRACCGAKSLLHSLRASRRCWFDYCFTAHVNQRRLQQFTTPTVYVSSKRALPSLCRVLLTVTHFQLAIPPPTHNAVFVLVATTWLVGNVCACGGISGRHLRVHGQGNGGERTRASVPHRRRAL